MKAAEKFLHDLSNSGLLSAEECQQVATTLSEVAGADEAANRLVADGVLTRWQANKLLAGRHKGFFLAKYKILDHLGSGGMSNVYLAEHSVMQRRVAIKVLPLRRATDPAYLARFYREAKAAAAVQHPNVVHAYDFDQEGRFHFIVMEYVPGSSLQQLVRQQGPVAPREAARLIQQAALGLEHAHRVGIVHRDVKPANLLVDQMGTAKILDLGLALFAHGDADSLTEQHGQNVLGTADYLAPEQAVDSHAVDARADVYGLGCTLYFALTGQPPFNEGSVAERIRKHRSEPPPPIESLRLGVPSELTAICGRMMAKSPDERYQSADAAAAALAGWIAIAGSTEPESGADETFPAVDVSRAEIRPESMAKPAASVHNRPQSDFPQGESAAEPSQATPDRPVPSPAAAPPWLWLLTGAVIGAIIVTAILLLRMR